MPNPYWLWKMYIYNFSYVANIYIYIYIYIYICIYRPYASVGVTQNSHSDTIYSPPCVYVAQKKRVAYIYSGMESTYVCS